MIPPSRAFYFFLIGATLSGSLVYLAPTLSGPNIDIQFWAYLAGTVIAVCALFITVKQSLAIQKHNSISVTPHLSLNNHIIGKELSIEAFITNNGLGPARILSFDVLLDEKTQLLYGAKQVFLVTEQLLKGQNYHPSVGHLDIGSLLSNGAQARIFKVSFIGYIDQSEEFINIWRRIKGRVRIRVKYESLYGEKYILNDIVDD